MRRPPTTIVLSSMATEKTEESLALAIAGREFLLLSPLSVGIANEDVGRARVGSLVVVTGAPMMAVLSLTATFCPNRSPAALSLAC